MSIIQAFTALWEIKFERMAVILKFVKMYDFMTIFKFNVKYLNWDHDQKSKLSLFAQFLSFRDL